MEWNEWIRTMFSIEKKVLDKEIYSRIEIDFGKAVYQGNNVKLDIYGNSLIKIGYTGNVGDATIRLGHRHANKLPMTEFRSIRTLEKYEKLYLSSTDTQGKLILVGSFGLIMDIKPSIREEIEDAQVFDKTDYLAVNATDATDSLTPASGKRLLIRGFTVSVAKGAPTGCDGAVYLYFGDWPGSYLWVLPTWEDGIGNNTHSSISISGIRKLLPIDTAITLRNHIWTGGSITNVAAVIYYNEV